MAHATNFYRLSHPLCLQWPPLNPKRHWKSGSTPQHHLGLRILTFRCEHVLTRMQAHAGSAQLNCPNQPAQQGFSSRCPLAPMNTKIIACTTARRHAQICMLEDEYMIWSGYIGGKLAPFSLPASIVVKSVCMLASCRSRTMASATLMST